MSKRTIRYIITAAAFVILAVAVSFSVIWLKYKVIEFEAAFQEPQTRKYSGYYNSLSYRQQLLYDCIIESAVEVEEESAVLKYDYDMEEFQWILRCIRADRPELFYLDFDSLVLYHGKHRTKVGMAYLCNRNDIEDHIQEYDAAVENAIKSINCKGSDFERELAVNDYIADNCGYAIGTTSVFSNTAYGSLVEGAAYCEGYAYGAKQLFNKAGLDSYVVYGSADGAEHTWNLVECGDGFYHTDVMWNDGGIEAESSLRFHGYFNLNDSEISIDHTVDKELDILPKASLQSNYYQATGAYAATVSELEDILVRLLFEAVEQNREYIELCCLETRDGKDINTIYKNALQRVNRELGYNALFEAFSIYNAHAHSNAITIQIFYNS